MKPQSLIESVPYLQMICVVLENPRKPDLRELQNHLPARNLVPMRWEISFARKNADRLYQEFGQQTNSIGFASPMTFAGG